MLADSSCTTGQATRHFMHAAYPGAAHPNGEGESRDSKENCEKTGAEQAWEELRTYANVAAAADRNAVPVAGGVVVPQGTSRFLRWTGKAMSRCG